MSDDKITKIYQKPSDDEEEEFNEKLQTALVEQDEIIASLPEGVGWMPQSGSQEAFLTCPAFECLLEGTRGGGKTDVLLMDFAKDTGRGFGAQWRGILFRQTYPQLADVTAKIMRWFPMLFGSSFKFNLQSKVGKWDTGEQLLLRHMKRPEDYWNYHGHEYPWIAWEELTNWESLECYKSMMSCCRTSNKKIRRRIRATTNPYGRGHNPVKAYFRLPQSRDTIQVIGKQNPKTKKTDYTERVVIHSSISENKILLQATPDYVTQLIGSASNEAQKQAWLEGDWDITAGGMFDDIWRECKDHIMVDPFPVPKNWKLTRAFDWGGSKPFSVGWYAESQGETIRYANGKELHTLKGDLFRIREWYGSKGSANVGLDLLPSEITSGIIEREIKWGIYGRVTRGVADSAIFGKSRDKSIAKRMAEPVDIDGVTYKGVKLEPCKKTGEANRVNGWQECREYLSGTKPKKGARENVGLFVFKFYNPQWERTFPTLPRDEDDMDDVDTKVEDHIGDEVRYRISWNKYKSSTREG